MRIKLKFIKNREDLLPWYSEQYELIGIHTGNLLGRINRNKLVKLKFFSNEAQDFLKNKFKMVKR